MYEHQPYIRICIANIPQGLLVFGGEGEKKMLKLERVDKIKKKDFLTQLGSYIYEFIYPKNSTDGGAVYKTKTDGRLKFCIF